MTVKFLVIPRVMVSGFTYLANHVSAGLPSLTSVTGLGQSIALQCRRSGVPCDFRTISIALRTPATNMGHAKYARATFADKDELKESEKPGRESKFISPTIDDLKGSILLDLVVALDVDDDMEHELSAEFLTQVVRTQKFSGSEMRNVRGGPLTVKVYDTLASAFASIPGAALMVEDASQVLTTYAFESQQSVKSALLDLVSRERTVPRKTSSSEDAPAEEDESEVPAVAASEPAAAEPAQEQLQRPSGYFVPAATGFALLEEPRVKQDSRAPGVPHAYAEPLLGLVRVRQVASVRAQIRRAIDEELAEPYPAVFWKPLVYQSDACPYGVSFVDGYA